VTNAQDSAASAVIFAAVLSTGRIAIEQSMLTTAENTV